MTGDSWHPDKVRYGTYRCTRLPISRAGSGRFLHILLNLQVSHFRSSATAGRRRCTQPTPGPCRPVEDSKVPWFVLRLCHDSMSR
ncbi:hypothetical protein VTK56DRAFT_2368 [Thermocarpiscus australiensis]